jgi:hypothetical protein
VFRSIGLIVILLVATTGCSIIKATPTDTVKTGTLTGVVTGPTGPVGGANVQVAPADNSYHVGQTDSQGYFSVSTIPSGSALLTVSAPGYQTYTSSVVIPENGTATQNVSLSLK